MKYESLAEAVAAVKDGETILMLADVPNAGGMSVSSGKNFTVDFDGHTYTLNKPGAGSTGTETNGFQLLMNSTIVFKNGTINISEENLTKAVDPAKNIMRIIQNYANLTLENMTIDGTNQYGGKDYIMSFNNGTSVIKDTKVVGADKIAFDVCTWSSYKATSLDVTGNSEIKGDIEISSTNTPDALSLMLTSGTHDGAIIMAQGADKATVSKVNEFVQAAPEGYKWVDNGNDTSTLKPCEYICAIGETKYETLAEAVAAAGTAETTITLLTDAATDGVISGNGVKVLSGSNITFDLNGLTYNVTGETVGSTGYETQAFQLLKDSKVTFTNGTITSTKAQMLIQNYCDLTLTDVTLDGSNLIGDEPYTLSNNSGNVNLNGETNIIAKNGGFAFDTCKFGSYAIPTVNVNTTGTISGKIEATGGKLNIENGKFDVTWVTDSHYAAGDIQIKGGVFTAKVNEEYCAEGFVCTDNDDPTYKYTVKSMEDAGIFVLLDNETDYDRETTVMASKITYIRSFSKNVTNHRQCWFVPFEYTVTDEDKKHFKFYKIHMVAASDKDVTTEVTDNTQVYVYIEEMTDEEIILKANRPYVIKPNKVLTDYEFIAENAVLEGRNTGSRLNVTTAEYSYDFYATYSTFQEENQQPHSWIGVNTSGNLFWNKEGSSLHRYRWYIKITKNATNEGYAKPNLVFIENDDQPENTPTSISPNSIDGEIEGFYTLGGVKLDQPKKGVNIVRFTNGTTKKIYIK